MESDKQKPDKNARLITFSFNEEEDSDILNWIDNLPKGDRSKIAREVFRFYLNRDKPSPLTLNDLMTELEEIKAKMEQSFIIKKENNEDSEPEEAAKNLDDLLGRIKLGEFG